MKKLVLVTNDLPGAGKSTLSEVLVTALAKAGVKTAHVATHCSVDADDRITESPDVVAWDFEEEEEEDEPSKLVELLDSHDAIVVDVGTGDSAELHSFAERTQLFECLSELGVEITIAIPLGHDADRTDAVVEIAECFSDNADYLVLREHDADDGWEDSYAKKVMSYLSAVEITAPSANGSLEKALDDADCELHQALALRKKQPRGLKTAIAKWERAFADRIESEARAYIFPQLEESRVLGISEKPARRPIAVRG